MDRLEGIIEERGYHLPPLDEITFICTTMKDECDTGTAVLVPVDGTDTYYYPEEAANYNEVLGENTEYTIDPEECMADNFGYLLAYDAKGPAISRSFAIINNSLSNGACAAHACSYSNPHICQGKILMRRIHFPSYLCCCIQFSSLNRGSSPEVLP